MTHVKVLLCDADGNLFPSEEPAFVASAEVTNRMLADLGCDRRYGSAELRNDALGRNFRSTALEVAARHGLTLGPDELERYVEEERQAVTLHLARVLEPHPGVLRPLETLAHRFRLAVVTSSASARLDACFRATGLDELFPPHLRFSAEDSLGFPRSKPDPAIYRHAGDELGVSGGQALAIEDAVPGVLSAVAAGFPTVGNLIFVPPDEREVRRAALSEAGAVAVVDSWSELGEMIGISAPEAAAR